MRAARITLTAAALAATGVLAGAGVAAADSGAHGAAVGSPGIVSGNVIQAPVSVPANVCGNSINIVGILNPAVGNVCVND
ncbi:chaplin [Streptomyces gilvosporeus]|uniref:Chaplin n=1 Tax=Streptomyces gilvosporeus TaxID=553510 RepID=A0A1V0TNR9_9ACTN|nr:chaplin [Streptomyces gilvosporeus]ARF54586.1 chaplin [Streptomyces gilvosporeus]